MAHADNVGIRAIRTNWGAWRRGGVDSFVPIVDFDEGCLKTGRNIVEHGDNAWKVVEVVCAKGVCGDISDNLGKGCGYALLDEEIRLNFRWPIRRASRRESG
jgi:hypothetical protein